jgi:hypothetical protein
LGIDADQKWAEYQDYVAKVKGGMSPAFITSPPRPSRPARTARTLPVLNLPPAGASS